MRADVAKAGWKSPKWWLRVTGGALFGGVVGYLGADFILDGGRDISASALVALGVALIFVLPGIVVLVGTISPAIGIALNMVEDREAWEDERKLLFSSGIGCVLIAMWVLSLLAVEPLGLADARTGLATSLVLLAAASWFTWQTWAAMDELWRKVSSEATVMAFYLIFAPGAAWSAGAHLGLVEALAPLDWISLFLIATLVGSVIATARRGMIENR